jgi:hypothetical protein
VSHVQAYRNNGANDEGVVVAKHDVVGVLEAHPKLRTAVLLRMLQCTARKQKTSKKFFFFVLFVCLLSLLLSLDDS